MADGHQGKGPDPSTIMQLATAYWGSQTLLTANRIGLFALLGDQSLTQAETASALGTAERPTGLLLQACAGLGLLEPYGDGYRNTAVSNAYLVPGKPSYLGDALRYSDDLYTPWAGLEKSLREDAPAQAEEAYLGEDAARTRNFVLGMHNRALAVGQALTNLVDLGGRRRMLDVGGGPGTYSALFALRHSDLRSTVLDLPEVVKIAEEIVAGMGVADRIETLAGDYRSTPFPDGQDAVLISGVLHRETAAGCIDLVRRARDALVPGGALILSDVMTDSTGLSPPFATLFGLNMLLTAPDGGVHRDLDARTWMGEAGLVDIEVKQFPPPLPHRVIVGMRPLESRAS